MATKAIHLARPLLSVVQDLATTRLRIANCIASGRDETPLELRRMDLEREIEAALFADTGVNWDVLKAVMD
jgi:hypothetical protein